MKWQGEVVGLEKVPKKDCDRWIIKVSVKDYTDSPTYLTFYSERPMQIGSLLWVSLTERQD